MNATEKQRKKCNSMAGAELSDSSVRENGRTEWRQARSCTCCVCVCVRLLVELMRAGSQLTGSCLAMHLTATHACKNRSEEWSGGEGDADERPLIDFLSFSEPDCAARLFYAFSMTAVCVCLFVCVHLYLSHSSSFLMLLLRLSPFAFFSVVFGNVRLHALQHAPTHACLW